MKCKQIRNKFESKFYKKKPNNKGNSLLNKCICDLQMEFQRTGFLHDSIMNVQRNLEMHLNLFILGQKTC